MPTGWRHDVLLLFMLAEILFNLAVDCDANQMFRKGLCLNILMSRFVLANLSAPD